MIRFSVNHQRLTTKGVPFVVGNSLDYLTAKCDFTDDWDGFAKVIFFHKGNDTYPFLLNDDNEITADQHLNLASGEWDVYVYGFNGYVTDVEDLPETVERISTNVVKLLVNRHGGTNGTPIIIEPASIGEQILASIGGKMGKNNPVGTGSFSMNRKAGTSVGFNSCTEGLECIASGHVSHAEGERTVANADWTHAEGYCTVADAFISHSEGDHTRASGDASHAEGEWTVAQSPFQHVQGKYNAVDAAGAFADIVGWGSDEDHRKNISSLETNGDLHLAGNVYVSADDDGTSGDKLATEDFVLTTIQNVIRQITGQ